MARFFGWKRDFHDPRDLYYSAPRTLFDSLPSAVDLSSKYRTEPFDQGSIGSCGPNSASADIVYDQLQVGQATIPSRLFVYWNTRHMQGTVNEDSGVSNREMLKALAQYGWCDETLWPYDTSKFTQRPTDGCYQQAAPRKITQYLRVIQDLQQMQSCLAGGDPFIFGFSVFASIESPQVEQTGILPMPRTGERIIGGHDVLIVGYSAVTQRFKFLNSWGKGWGNGGFGEIPYSYALNPRWAADFWTIRWKDQMPRPSPVPPQPSPVDKTRVTIIVGGGFANIEKVEVVE